METVKSSFGNKGGLFFALLNVLQLVGWTAIMIYDGALAAGGIFSSGHWIWCLVIGVLIIAVLNNGLNILGVSSYYQDVVKGIVILIAVLSDRRR